MAEGPDLFASYWQIRMDSAQRRMDAALDLIAHKPTRGALAEDLVRELINSFLPGRWVSGRGFVVDAAHNPSAQLDILLFDQLNNAPLYRDERVIVLPAGTRPMGIEVKSILDKTELFAGLENIASLKRLDPGAAGIVFAFRGFAKPETLASHLVEHVDRTKAAGTFNAGLLPDMICLHDQRTVVLRQPGGGHQLVAYRTVGPAFQSLLTEVLNGLRTSSLFPFLPKPKYETDPLFMV